MNEMYEYLEEHAYISKNKKSNYQFELSKARAECIANKYNSLCEEKDKEIERLNNIIKRLEENLREMYLTFGEFSEEYTEKKIKEIKRGNEPNFEEMVRFVENVYKDIKSQPTLHEELEEERKTIAKIVGDFKEVNK